MHKSDTKKAGADLLIQAQQACCILQIIVFESAGMVNENIFAIQPYQKK